MRNWIDAGQLPARIGRRVRVRARTSKASSTRTAAPPPDPVAPRWTVPQRTPGRSGRATICRSPRL
ncbi:MAG: hypothetical protein M3065_22675 [Actinomycetota bacterium]|nr:hypothetical protein [Actinomycetota bacterium]